MATEEHRALAMHIKGVHQSLRVHSRKMGVEVAWKEHCSQYERLQNYAFAMQQLATKFWDQNSNNEMSNAKCRIDWVVSHCLDYFKQGGRENEKQREEKKKKTMLCCNKLESSSHSNIETLDLKDTAIDNYDCHCLKLLDVGSCYNPFKTFPFFKVLPIDLAPASVDVLKCDFLNTTIVNRQDSGFDWEILKELSSLDKLPANYFDIVVFCLLLEYMPSPQQRYTCCTKAYALLKTEGLLFIITPDSKHATANAPIMKKWRIALAHMGFSRIVYEKLPHIHCMAFRKCCNPGVPRYWALQTMMKQTQSCCDSCGIEDFAKLMNIPQDFHKYEDQSEDSVQYYEQRTEADHELLVDMFAQLPNI